MRLLRWPGQRYRAGRSTDKGLSHARQLSLDRTTWPAKSQFSGGDDVVSKLAREAGRERVNILVEQESHEAAVNRMSSAWTTSMAHWILQPNDPSLLLLRKAFGPGHGFEHRL